MSPGPDPETEIPFAVAIPARCPRRHAARCRLVPLVFVALLASAGVSQERPPDPEAEKLDAIRAVAEALEREENLSPDLKQALAALLAVLEREARAAAVSDVELAERLDLLTVHADEHEAAGGRARWSERLDLSGDFRLRLESDTDRDDASDRDRTRLRGRLGATYAIDEEFDVGGRLVTGDRDDPRSTHVTLGDAFDDFEVSFDRLYADYHPTSQPGLAFRAGKFAHPVWRNPIYGQLVWDADVQPEGLVATHEAADVVGLDRLDVVAGYYVVDDDTGAVDDVSAFVAQVSGQADLAHGWGVTGAVGYTRYSDLTPDGSQAIVADNAGNALNPTGTAFLSDFSIVNPIVGLTYDGLGRPLSFAGELIHNTQGAEGRDNGWALGLAYGQTRQPGDWRWYYQYQAIEQDAVLSAFAQDDFLLTTGFRGHVGGWQYQLKEDVRVHLWGLISARMASTTSTASERNDQTRLRLDIDVRF